MYIDTAADIALLRKYIVQVFQNQELWMKNTTFDLWLLQMFPSLAVLDRLYLYSYMNAYISKITVVKI